MSNFIVTRVSQMQDLLLKESLKSGDFVVDATLGNGFDALHLLELIGENGFLIGFDIQPVAIEQTKLRLQKAGYDQFQLICDSHEHMAEYVAKDQPKGIVFNLGYLPKADKMLTTQWQSTQIAVTEALNLIPVGGFVAITAYPGHEAGKVESDGLSHLLESLDQKIYQVMLCQMTNQVNEPPILYWISKR